MPAFLSIVKKINNNNKQGIVRMRRNRKYRKAFSKKVLSLVLTAAMLATFQAPVWAEVQPVIEDVSIVTNEAGGNLYGDPPADAVAVQLKVGGDKTVAAGSAIEWGSTVEASLSDGTAESTAWTAGGVQLGNTASYAVKKADVGKTITCTVKPSGAGAEVFASFTVKAITATTGNATITMADALGYTYDKTEKRPNPTVTVTNEFGTVVMTDGASGEDTFAVTYLNNTNAGEADSGNGPKAVITFVQSSGITGSVMQGFAIKAKELKVDNTTLTLDINAEKKVTFSQNPADYLPVLRGMVSKVTVGDTELSPSDYLLELEGANEAGKRQLKLTGQGNYGGEVAFSDPSCEVTLEPKDLSGFSLKAIAPQPYADGAEVILKDPNNDIVLTDSGKKADGTAYTLIYGNGLDTGDYRLSYSANYALGTAKVSITGINNYKGEKTASFQIQSGVLTGLKTALDNDLNILTLTYTGSPIDPVKQVYGNGTYQYGRDYTYSITNNTNATTGASKAKITVTGVHNYAGKSFTSEFSIGQYDIGGFTSKNVSIADTVYDSAVGTNQAAAAAKYKPKAVITFGGKALREGTDYTLNYAYTNIANENTPQVDVTITGSGNFEGSKSGFASKIVGKSLAGTNISGVSDQYFTGFDLTPEVIVKDGAQTLVKDTDYTVTYSNNREVGTATVTIKGIKRYSGERKLTFRIFAKPNNGYYIVKADASGITAADQKLPGVVYDQAQAETAAGIAQTKFKVLNKNKETIPSSDYIVTYSNNKAVGTAGILITGINGKDISASSSFAITPAKLPGGGIIIGVMDSVYTGAPITFADVKYEATAPGAKSPLELNKDYYISYQNNTEVGTAAVRVIGRGNYADSTGTVSTTFQIAKADLTAAQAKISAEVPYAGGQSTTADITVTNPNGGRMLDEGGDYQVSYSLNKEIGTASATLILTSQGQKHYRFVGNGSAGYTQLTLNYEIVAFDFKDAAIEKVADQDYTGKAVEPELQVKAGNTLLRKGVDYTVEFTGNVEPGTATAVIKPVKGVAGYTGSASTTFRIVKKPAVKPNAPKVTAASSTKAIKVSWTKVESVDGYVVYSFAKADRKTITERKIARASATSLSLAYKPGTVRTFVVRAYKNIDGKNVYSGLSNIVAAATKPEAARIKSTAAGKGTARVTLTGKPAGAVGYAYCVSTDGMTYRIVAKGPKMPYTMKGLTKGRNYIKVRAYVRDHTGKSVYAGWSQTVKVTVK